jgi:transketolase
MKKNIQIKGLNRDAWFARDLFNEGKLKQLATRDGYGEGLVEAGKKDGRVVVLCADVTESTRCLAFKTAYPDRFVQIGVSEQSMASIAAGMSLAGKVPFINAYASFSPGRNWEQIRTCVALQNSNVKIVGGHAGVTVGPDGATHQMTEDLALMRVLPNMRIVVPCDAIEAKKATLAIEKDDRPYYIRLAREKSPVFTTQKTPFKIGRAQILRHGADATIIGCGAILYEALIAAQRLSEDHGIECAVINMHTIKPLDVKAIVKAAKETGAIVTVEDAQVAGGLAGAVAETLALTVPVPMERIGVQDRFGESGTARELQVGLGLTAEYIALAVDRVIQRKLGHKVPETPAHILAAQEKFVSSFPSFPS